MVAKTRKSSKDQPFLTADDLRLRLLKVLRAPLPPRKAPRPGRREVVGYHEHIVCFVDLLGFRQRVASMTKAEARAEIALLEKLFSKVVEQYEPGETDLPPLRGRIRVNYFSDCFCLALSLKVKNLKAYVDRIFSFLVHLLHIQGEFIAREQVLRGAVVIGRHYSSDRLIFSPAQVRAYELESRKAVDPIILLDQSIFDRLKAAAKRLEKDYPDGQAGLREDITSIFRVIANREDGKSFLHYLGFWTEIDDEYDVRPFFKGHKRLIENAASKVRANRGVLSKYRWMARYHNSYVKKLFPKDSDLKIDLSAFGTITTPDVD